MPRVVRLVYENRLEIFSRQHSPKSCFQTTDAQKPLVHSASFPYPVADHVPFPPTFLVATLTATRRCIDPTIIASCTHATVPLLGLSCLMRGRIWLRRDWGERLAKELRIAMASLPLAARKRCVVAIKGRPVVRDSRRDRDWKVPPGWDPGQTPGVRAHAGGSGSFIFARGAPWSRWRLPR